MHIITILFSEFCFVLYADVRCTCLHSKLAHNCMKTIILLSMIVCDVQAALLNIFTTVKINFMQQHFSCKCATLVSKSFTARYTCELSHHV